MLRESTQLCNYADMSTIQLLTAEQVAAKVGLSRSQINRDSAGEHPKLPPAFSYPGDKGPRLFEPGVVERIYHLGDEASK